MNFENVRSIAWKTVLEMLGLTDSGTSTVIFQATSHAKAALPAAATYPRGVIYVSDETGGATLAFSDGTNWRRCQDRNIVS